MLEFNPELLFQIKSVNRCLYFVTEEEDRFLQALHQGMSKAKTRNVVKIYNHAFGLRLLSDHISDWVTKKHVPATETLSPQEALAAIYKDSGAKGSEGPSRFFYLITDPERFFNDANLQRRLLNLIHQINNDPNMVKILIFVGLRTNIPTKLIRYVDVIQDKGLSDEEIKHISKSHQNDVKLPGPEDSQLRGFTSWEIRNLFYSFYQKQQKSPVEWSEHIKAFKSKQLAKSKLVTLEPTNISADQVGGLSRFKKWVSLSKACWTKEGQEFGLKVPKSVLLLGIWGCGKSMSVRFMGHEWGVSVLRLNLGNLRSSAQGDSEGNIQKVLTLADQMAPCILWIDEAGRALSGSKSSNTTDSGTTDRILSILDTWIQEHESQVCLVMTTNDLSTLPAEIVDRSATKYFFDLPTSGSRSEILSIHLKKLKQSLEASEAMVSSSEGLGGRNIEAALDYAMMLSFNQGLKTLDEAILVECLQNTPRLSETMSEEFTALRSWVGFDERTGEGVKAYLAEEPEEPSQLSLE